MAEVELIYEVFAEGESPNEFDTPLYEAETAEGAKLACRTHFDDGFGGSLVIYREGRKVATARLVGAGVDYAVVSGEEF
jgi:hypothetical protein